MNRLLIVEDDIATCLALSSFFSDDFEIEIRNNGYDFVDTIKEFKPDLIMLDLNLPGPNGFKLLSAMNSNSLKTPVFMITVRSDETEMLKAFELGVSDYITKPFSLKVLEARIRRWVKKLCSESIVKIGLAVVDLIGAKVKIGEKQVELSRKEVLVLRYLLSNQGQILTRQQILDYAWGYDFEGTPRTVDNVILSIRKKLNDPNGPEASIQSHRGLGYSLSIKLQK